jgi:hypothetical protein
MHNIVLCYALLNTILISRTVLNIITRDIENISLVYIWMYIQLIIAIVNFKM